MTERLDGAAVAEYAQGFTGAPYEFGTGEPEDVQPPDAEFVCGRCRRRQHSRCSDPLCGCCEGNP